MQRAENRAVLAMKLLDHPEQLIDIAGEFADVDRGERVHASINALLAMGLTTKSMTSALRALLLTAAHGSGRFPRGRPSAQRPTALGVQSPRVEETGHAPDACTRARSRGDPTTTASPCRGACR